MKAIHCIKAILISILVLQAVTLYATVKEHYPFTDPTQQQRFYTLLSELRCVVCQNESLAESQATIAKNLTQQIYGMMQDGFSDEEILEYLVARYGDFILFKPRLTPKTYVLWFAPWIFLLLAIIIMVRSIRSKKSI